MTIKKSKINDEVKTQNLLMNPNKDRIKTTNILNIENKKKYRKKLIKTK